jgi:hypothetical protein
MFFSTLPAVAEGFQLKIWRSGPEAGKPKLSPMAKGLLKRGLMRLDTSRRLRSKGRRLRQSAGANLPHTGYGWQHCRHRRRTQLSSTLRLKPHLAAVAKPLLDLTAQPKPKPAPAPVKANIPPPAPAEVARVKPPKPALTPEPLAAKEAEEAARTQVEMKEAAERRVVVRDAHIAALRAQFPTVFDADEPRPLAIGIRQPVREALGMPSKTQVNYLLTWWTQRPAYLAALVAGGPRYSLDDAEAGEITEDQKARAATQLGEVAGGK